VKALDKGQKVLIRIAGTWRYLTSRLVLDARDETALSAAVTLADGSVAGQVISSSNVVRIRTTR
jgi:hypothetical protein